MSRRSLIGDITLDLSRGRKIRAFRVKRTEGEKVIPSIGNSLCKRLVNEHIMNEYGRSGNKK